MPDHTRLRSSAVIAQRAIEDVLLRIHVVESGTEKCLPGGLTTCDARIVMPTLVTMDAPPACYGYLSLGRLSTSLRRPQASSLYQRQAAVGQDDGAQHQGDVETVSLLSHSMEMPSAQAASEIGWMDSYG